MPNRIATQQYAKDLGGKGTVETNSNRIKMLCKKKISTFGVLCNYSLNDTSDGKSPLVPQNSLYVPMNITLNGNWVIDYNFNVTATITMAVPKTMKNSYKIQYRLSSPIEATTDYYDIYTTSTGNTVATITSSVSSSTKYYIRIPFCCLVYGSISFKTVKVSGTATEEVLIKDNIIPQQLQYNISGSTTSLYLNVNDWNYSFLREAKYPNGSSIPDEKKQDYWSYITWNQYIYWAKYYSGNLATAFAFYLPMLWEYINARAPTPFTVNDGMIVSTYHGTSYTDTALWFKFSETLSQQPGDYVSFHDWNRTAYDPSAVQQLQRMTRMYESFANTWWGK